MEQDEIRKGKHLIAKYMGGKLVDHPELKGVKKWTEYEPIEGLLDLDNNLKFDSSWDTLMPVIDKIESMVEYYQYICETSGQFRKDALVNSKYIEVTFEHVIEFIEWYNKLNKEQ
jgi:hypothetical protein